MIGGGHNGLTARPTWRRRARGSLVLERRHVLGGAAVTEEVFPGFRFSVVSYVVSLLRPGDHPRARPARSTAWRSSRSTGRSRRSTDDYLWRVNDHGRTVRELAGGRPSDAEAYEEYGQLMADMARFIKPILSVVAARPGPVPPDGVAAAHAASRRRSATCPSACRQTFIQLMTMSAADFLDQWFETEPLKATMSASGIIGTYQGAALARHGVRAAAPLHGRDRRCVPRMGHPEGRHRRRVERDRVAPRSRSAWRSGPRPGRPRRHVGWPGHRRHAGVRRGDRRPATCCRSLDSGLTFLKLLEPGALDRSSRPRSGATSSAAPAGR